MQWEPEQAESILVRLMSRRGVSQRQGWRVTGASRFRLVHTLEFALFHSLRHTVDAGPS